MLKVSLIIATCNRCKDLEKILECLLKQEGNNRVICEVLVVDNNSTDDTRQTVRAYEGKYSPQVLKYMFEERQGKSYALNTAIEHSKGDVIVFIDDDVIPERDWLAKIDEFIQSYEFDAACGRIAPLYLPDFPVWVKDNIDILSGPIVSYDYGPETKIYDQQQMHPLVGANMIVKRQLFDEVGFFRTDLGPGAGTFGDDTEMCLRWEKKNKKLYYVGTAMVWHPAVKKRMTLGYIARWNMASGKYLVVKEKGEIEKHIVRYGEIPRYLIRRILEQTVKLICSCFNKRSFLIHWVLLFREIGTAKAYREHYRSSAKGI